VNTRAPLPSGHAWVNNTIKTDGYGKTHAPTLFEIKDGQASWSVGCACYPIGGGAGDSCGDPYCFRTQPPHSKVGEYISEQERRLGIRHDPPVDFLATSG
jgi:hypothetical protein